MQKENSEIIITGKYALKQSRICTNCVMDNTDPLIIFDSNGVCNHCNSYEERKKQFVPEADKRQQALGKIITFCRKKGKGKDYDCVIGVSGGVDSTYVAFLVKSLGLRPLAVHLDNGWNSELAISNIKGVLSKLNIELHTHVLDWEEFKSLQLAFLRASTPDSEIPTDHAIGALLRKMAAKENVPLLWGANFSSESILPSSWSQGHMDWGYIKNVNRLFGESRLHSYPHYSIWRLMYYNRIKLQRTFEVLNCIDYDKEKAKDFLIKELGWRDYGGKHHESIYTRIFQSYILPVKFGYDKRRAHYSSLILAGQMTRQEALELLKEPPYNTDAIEEDIEYLIKKLKITRKEFVKIMNTELQFYNDLSPALPKAVARIERSFFRKLYKFRRYLLNKVF